MAKLTQDDLAAIAEAVQNSYSIAGVLRTLGLRVAGANYDTVKHVVRTLGLDTSHWTGKGHRKGSHVPVVRPRPLHEILVRASRVNSHKLRKRLLKEGILSSACSECGLVEWRGGTIPLELDHRDGDRTNNELGNLRLLCPNCHALTPNYRGRNIGKIPIR